MKINVLTVDKQIITLDVDLNDLVGDVKASLKVEREELLYDGKEMNNNDKLSALGVQEGDLIEVVSDSAPISSSSTTELSLNQDGSAMKLAAFQHELQHELQHEIQHTSNLVAQLVQGVTDFESVSRNGEGEDCLASLTEMEMFSHLLDEEKNPEQELVEVNNEVNEEVKVQTNGGSIPAKENDHDHRHVLNSSDKESSTASIQKAVSGDHNESNHFASHEHVDDMLLANHSKGAEVRDSELIDSSLSSSMTSPFSPNPHQTTTKGHGLKKWRRIRREITKDPSTNLDSTKVLKRGSSNISDVKKPNDGSVSSTNAFVKSPGHVDLFSNPAPSSNYKVALGTTFSAGTDDSEDRSSKSSTAASAPKHRHDVAKLRGKNVSGRHLNSSSQRFQPGKGHAQADASKKPRGESINVDKENSLSSMESDSRSYSSVFPRGTSSVNSDQVQSGRSANYNEEDDYDQQASEVQSSKKLQAGHSKNGHLSPACSAELSCSANVGQSKDHQVSRDCEPLLNSILLLQAAQEALEREVQMFKEIGKGVNSLCDDSGKATNVSAYSMFVGPEACVDRSYSSNAEFNHVQTLERNLNEAQVRLKEKDLEVVKLEKIVKKLIMESTQAYKRSPWHEMEAELETVFKLKVEAEVHYVVMTGSRKDLSVLIEDQVKLLRDQNVEASRKLIADVGNKRSILQDQAKLDNLRREITEDEDIRKMKSRVAKFGSYLVIQLVLLVFVVVLFLLRALPKSATVVPT